MAAPRVLLGILLVLLVSIPYSRNASLSVAEQKRYKDLIEGQGLYSTSDDVEILTAHNFKRELLNSPQAWLVEFYNSWCGFCQRFAPSWKALGTSVKNWNHMVKIAAMDCADDENFPICREYEIMAYPTLRYFHENYEEGPKNIGIEVMKGDDVNSHRYHVVSTIVQEKLEGRGHVYPDFKNYNHSNLGKLFDGLPETKQLALLVFQEPNSLLGEQLTLDLSKVPSVSVQIANNTALAEAAAVTKYPSLVVMGRNNNFETISDLQPTRESLYETVKNQLHAKKIEIVDVANQTRDIFKGKWQDADVPDMATLMQERAKKALKERIKRMGDVVFQADLEAALRLSLKNEVSRRKLIKGEDMAALRAFVAVLANYFPFGNGGQNFLNELKEEINKVEEIGGRRIAEMIKKAEDSNIVFSSPHQFLGCAGSAPHYRGYPCSLWKLFHYLTVNAAEHNAHNKDADPREVLSAMHGYIKNFFGCSDCSQHFQQMAVKLDMKNVSSLDGSVLWLWMAHNTVNKRLAGDETEDPEYPKYQFPSRERCPQCISPDDKWNFAEVLTYVKHVYSNINVRYLGSDTKVLHHGLGDLEPNGQQQDSIFFTTFKPADMSMCFILYVCSFFLLALLIRVFLKRGYRKKPYVHDLLGKV